MGVSAGATRRVSHPWNVSVGTAGRVGRVTRGGVTERNGP